MTRAALALLLVGCGRVAFAPLAADGATTVDTPDGTTLQDDVVLWLRFEDDPSDGTDDSGPARSDASCFTNCPSSTTGRYGSAASFNSMGQAFSAMLALPTTDFTWTVWVRATSSQPYAGVMSIHSEGSLSPGGAGIELLATQYLLFVNGDQIASGDNVTLDTWMHVAFVRTPAMAVQYIDGVEVNRSNDAVAHDFAGCALLIGVDADIGCTGGLNGYYDGGLDELRIYNRALTANEIVVDLNSSAPVPRN